MTTKKTAVLILNYNGEAFLKDCFDSLLKVKEKDDCFDIYLLDNNSKDDSVSFTQKRFPSIKVIETGSNLGFSGAYNYAHDVLKKSKEKYDYYFILNNDTIACDEKIFTRTQEIFEKHPEIAIINPTVLNKDKSIQFQIGNFYFLSGTTISYNRGEYHKENKIGESRWSTGSALFIRSRIFDALGGFDDYFMYMEDVALSWKALNAGYKVVCDFGSSIIHAHDMTKKSAHFSHFYAERNRLIMYWQNLSTFSFCCFLPFFVIIRLVIITAWFVLRDRNAKIALARLGGLWQAFFILHRFPKKNHSFQNDIRVINYFYKKPEIIN